MPYGTIKIDTVTFTDNGVDKSVTVSGLVQNPTFSGSVTVTGTVSGATVRGTTVSGATVTGTTANFASGVFTTQISGAVHIAPAGTVDAPSVQVGTGATVAPGFYGAGTDLLGISTGGSSRLIVDSVGQIRIIAAGSAAAPSLILGNDLTTGLYSPGAGQIAISTGGVGRLFIDSSGNIGISTNSPAVKLHVAGQITGTSTVYALRTSNGSGTDQTSIGLERVGAPTDQKYWELLHSGDGAFVLRTVNDAYSASQNAFFASRGSSYNVDNVQLLTMGSARLYINSSGNVGIGTTSPSTPLHVAGIARIGANSVADAELQIGAGATGDRNSFIDFVGDTTYSDYGLRLIRGNGGANATSTLAHRGTGTLYLNCEHAGNIAFQTSDTERARIDSSGRLLVGTSSALGTTSRLVEVANNIAISTYINNAFGYELTFNKSRGSANGTIVQTGDNIGSIAWRADDGTDTDTVAAQIGAFVDGTPGANDMPGRLVFSTTADGASSPTERMVIRADGKVGIGTSSPSQLFHVNGNVIVGGSPNAQWSTLTVAGDSAIQAAAPILHFVNAAGSARFAYINHTGTGGDLYLLNQEAGALRLGVGNTERARIDSSGRLLVGTSNRRRVGTPFDPVGGIFYEGFDTGGYEAFTAVVNRTDSVGAVFSFGKSGGSTNGSNTIVANGDQLGVIRFSGADGTDLESVAAEIRAEVDGTPGANDMPGRLVFSTTADGFSSPAERMRITQAGNVLIGRTTTTAPDTSTGVMFTSGGFLSLSASAEACSFNRQNSDGTVVQLRRGNTIVGSIDVTTTATSYVTSSDYRLKENVVAVTDGITRLQQLKPSRFNFIANPANIVDGFLAHEVESVVPEAITGEKDAVDADGNPVYQGIDQSKMVPLVVAALQECIKKVEALEAEVASLKAFV